MQVANRFLGNLGGGRSLTTTFKNARCTFQQRLLSLMDHRRMNLISGHQLRNSALALQNLQRNTSLELRVMVSVFRHVLISSSWGSADLRS
jgi:hypothetical protein